jgi:hypothetical protein
MVLEQNYFQFDRWISNGGSNISSTRRNIYATHGAHTNTPHLKKTKIVAYYKYVNDILINYDQNKTNIDDTL